MSDSAATARDEHGNEVAVNFGDEIPMRCAACGIPHPGFAKTAALARSYVCPCGSSRFMGTVTFRG